MGMAFLDRMFDAGDQHYTEALEGRKRIAELEAENTRLRREVCAYQRFVVRIEAMEQRATRALEAALAD